MTSANSSDSSELAKQTISNRIKKNLRKLKPWAKREQVFAYRIYDREIPEFPFIADIFQTTSDHASEINKMTRAGAGTGNSKVASQSSGDTSEISSLYAVLNDKGRTDYPRDRQHWQIFREAVSEVTGIPSANIEAKERRPQTREQRYQPLDRRERMIVVQEGPAKFLLNISDYLDTGLFLDHRPMRKRMHDESFRKDVLNLFSYTGSISVASALGGGRVTNVDLSRKYLDWAKVNHQLNDVDTPSIQFVESDVMEWLHSKPLTLKYDLIFCDPPTFSNSKKVEGTFDVERDHKHLVQQCMLRLKPGGQLYFSCNKREFKWHEHLNIEFKVEDISARTIPPDFHDAKIHRVFAVSQKVPGTFSGSQRSKDCVSDDDGEF